MESAATTAEVTVVCRELPAGFDKSFARVAKPSDAEFSWQGKVLADVLALIKHLRTVGLRGPLKIWHGCDWDQYLDGDFFEPDNSLYATHTLCNKLREAEGVVDVCRYPRQHENHTGTFALSIEEL